jgi:uncharacterized membrane protein
VSARVLTSQEAGEAESVVAGPDEECHMETITRTLTDAKRAELERRALEILETQAAVDALRNEHLTYGQRMADKLAAAVGSWRFIFGFLGFVALWVALNIVAWASHWDRYPFILLNLVLSVLAAVQAPVIMMSQNRAEARDRLHSQGDYKVSVKAEILMEHLTLEVEEIKELVARLEHERHAA